MSNVSIRRFEHDDIPNKVEWINNPENNRFLHYDLPLECGKTQAWFLKNKDRDDRYDAVIEADGVPVGLIGLLSIDGKNRKAEYYIAMGNTAYKGQGIATKATQLILRYAFDELNLAKIYLYTETGNKAAQGLFERTGFQQEGLLRNDLFSRGQFIDRYCYGMLREDYEAANANSTVGY